MGFGREARERGEQYEDVERRINELIAIYDTVECTEPNYDYRKRIRMRTGGLGIF